MSVLETSRENEPDPAPLWLPWHDAVAIEQSAGRPPDAIEGFGLWSQLATMVLGSRWRTFTRVGAAMMLVALPSLLPTYSGGNWSDLAAGAFFHLWTLALLLAISWRVRSVSLPTVATYWFTGMFSSVLIVHLLSGPLTALSDGVDGMNWIVPALEELAKALPLVLAVVLGRKLWRHPGLSDLIILGFAVGSGYAFHEEVLWGRVAGTGLGLDIGLLVPSVMRFDGTYVVGDAVWTALVGLAIGLFLLHRRRPLCFVLASFAMLAVLGDRMAAGRIEATNDWFTDNDIAARALIALLVGGAIAAVSLDTARLRRTAARDHLFPTDRRLVVIDTDNRADLFATLSASRYRRLLHGAHTTINATATHWPPLSHERPAPVAELARLGRAADIEVGPGSSPMGWAKDPDTRGAMRFVGRDGFTPFVAEDEALSLSTPPTRPEAYTVEREEVHRLVRVAARITSVVFLAVGVRLLMLGGEISVDDALAGIANGLPEAPNSPAFVPTLIGGVYALIAAFGLNRAQPGDGWEVGPTGNPPRTEASEV